MTDLRAIPGVGPSIEADLVALGVESVHALRGRDPEELYARLCAHQGTKVDRCVLYVFRCAVYFAEAEEHDPELLKWWSWKDAPAPPPPGGATPTPARPVVTQAVLEPRGAASKPLSPPGC